MSNIRSHLFIIEEEVPCFPELERLYLFFSGCVLKPLDAIFIQHQRFNGEKHDKELCLQEYLLTVPLKVPYHHLIQRSILIRYGIGVFFWQRFSLNERSLLFLDIQSVYAWPGNVLTDVQYVECLDQSQILIGMCRVGLRELEKPLTEIVNGRKEWVLFQVSD